MEANNVNIGIIGLGTVGISTIKMIEDNSELISKKCGKKINIIAISARDKKKNRGINLKKYKWFDDPSELVECDDLDIVIELVGGEEGVALEVINKAFKVGRHVITANKALVAKSGYMLAKEAESKKLLFYFEAAVAGGIPIIKSIRESLAGNEIKRVVGILNGTCNYILSEMSKSSRSFLEVLNEAKESGYAEDDPSFDIGGVDAAHKLSILASLSFGIKPSFDQIYIEGIEQVENIDFVYAKKLGYQIKLLGLTELVEVENNDDINVLQYVYPCFVKESSLLASIDGVRNAIITDSSHAGRSLFDGFGAGGNPTASSVVSDVIDIAKGVNNFTFGIPVNNLRKVDHIKIDQRRGSFYVRFTVIDRKGVFADIGSIFNQNGISMETVLQKNHDSVENKIILIITHEIKESFLKKAIKDLELRDFVVDKPKFIRIEDI